ncbi:hypothetical protein GCM10028811_12680 [Uliginosibacterium sediminicola]
MTYCGGATAAGCGAASASSQAAAHVPALASSAQSFALSDAGIYVGMAVGILGLLIQGYCALSRRLEERELHRLKKRRLRDPRTPLSIND